MCVYVRACGFTFVIFPMSFRSLSYFLETQFIKFDVRTKNSRKQNKTKMMKINGLTYDISNVSTYHILVNQKSVKFSALSFHLCLMVNECFHAFLF